MAIKGNLKTLMINLCWDPQKLFQEHVQLMSGLNLVALSNTASFSVMVPVQVCDLRFILESANHSISPLQLDQTAQIMGPNENSD